MLRAKNRKYNIDYLTGNKTMSRKKFPSDKTTTTVRVSRVLHKRVKEAAKKDRRTVEGFVDVALTSALTPKI